MLSRKWQKSSRSQTQGNCVELRLGETSVQIRDSKLGDASPIFGIDRADYALLLGELKQR